MTVSEQILTDLTLGKIIEAANLSVGAGASIHVGEYVLTLTRPRKVEEALKERTRVSGYLTLARATDEMRDGIRTRVAVVIPDPTPEGAEVREAQAKAAANRDADKTITRAGYGQNAKGWRPDPAAKPVPEEAPAPVVKVEPQTPLARWTIMHADWIETLKLQITQGRITREHASGLLTDWEAKHPRPNA